ncbi:kinase-like domain-containing protein, partial [Lentinula edodes]
KELDLLRFMHEIAKGMEYLHGQGVLHGDLKASFASNVLVDDKIHCVISDFGQSEMRSEAYRISGTALPHGTLRWQAPEIFAGSSQLTVEMDVYAFAICCTEVLSLARMPWPLYDDNQVQNHIMANQCPEVPPTCFTSPDLIDLIRLCWATNPLNRPLFSEVASELKALRKKS